MKMIFEHMDINIFFEEGVLTKEIAYHNAEAKLDGKCPQRMW